MEVSTLRDRRLVALFATVVIVGAGAAAAVVSMEHRAGYQGPAFGEASLAPELPEPGGPTDPPSPEVVAVDVEDPPGEAPGGARSAPHRPPPLAPETSEPETSEAAPGRAGTTDVGPAPRSTPRPARRSGSDVVIASDPEISKSLSRDDELDLPRSHERKWRADDEAPGPRRVDADVPTLPTVHDELRALGPNGKGGR